MGVSLGSIYTEFGGGKIQCFLQICGKEETFSSRKRPLSSACVFDTFFPMDFSVFKARLGSVTFYFTLIQTTGTRIQISQCLYDIYSTSPDLGLSLCHLLPQFTTKHGKFGGQKPFRHLTRSWDK